MIFKRTFTNSTFTQTTAFSNYHLIFTLWHKCTQIYQSSCTQTRISYIIFTFCGADVMQNMEILQKLAVYGELGHRLITHDGFTHLIHHLEVQCICCIWIKSTHFPLASATHADLSIRYIGSFHAGGYTGSYTALNLQFS